MEAPQTLVLVGNQAEKALRQAAEGILREIGPKFRLDKRDRPGKKWLTNREAQRYLDLSKPTLARYRAAGTLPYSKVGSSIYYRLSDVENLLERGMQFRLTNKNARRRETGISRTGERTVGGR